MRPVPRERRYEGFDVPRRSPRAPRRTATLEQAEASPDVARLSDEEETRLSLALGGDVSRVAGRVPEAARASAAAAWRSAAGRASPRTSPAGTSAPPRCCAGSGRCRSARSPGAAWARGRYHGPYLRDHLLDRGVFVETLETAAQWSSLFGALPGGGRRAARRRSGAAWSCATSRTCIRAARRCTSRSWPGEDAGGELEQWRAAKTAATDAIVAAGGTITHHHAVGPRPRDVAAEGGRRARDRRAARGQGRARPRRDHEPGEAARARLGRRSRAGLGAAAARSTGVPSIGPCRRISPGLLGLLARSRG